MLIDTPFFRRFAEIEAMKGRIPVATTIQSFNELSACTTSGSEALD
jgi:hypothetical protein